MNRSSWKGRAIILERLCTQSHASSKLPGVLLIACPVFIYLYTDSAPGKYLNQLEDGSYLQLQGHCFRNFKTPSNILFLLKKNYGNASLFGNQRNESRDERFLWSRHSQIALHHTSCLEDQRPFIVESYLHFRWDKLYVLVS